jgi:uncharacterized protein YdiU (UPF0061 family)
VTSASYQLKNERFDLWRQAWSDRVSEPRNARPLDQTMLSMRQNNPAFIPRNHLVEEAIAAGVTQGQFSPLDRLLEVLSQPYTERSELTDYRKPAPASLSGYRTFCGT